MLAVDALMKREGKEFTAEDLLHVYCIVRLRRNLETHMYEGFNAHFWRRSNRCVAIIIAVNNCRQTRNIAKLLGYVPSYHPTIPYRVNRRGQPRLPPLCICERALRRRSSLLIEVSDLIKGTIAELKQLREDAKGENTGRREVNQVPAIAPLVQILSAEPILVSSLDSEVTGDLDFPKVQPGTREIVEHLFDQGSNLGFSSREEEKVMVPKDMVDLATEDSEVFRGRLLVMGAQKHVMDLKKANEKIYGLEKELKQMKIKLSNARNTAKIAIGQRNQTQQEVAKLKEVACSEMYQKVFDRGYKRAGDAYEN
ncbi:hypothetical protein Acr_25g0002120 [Actinidia rufa]|uniref:Uncharacterized protein n=1 Tax=Actinidia rufa TaxID=165716 RepID=A0A7J0GYA4_9ERIC|nr:hypothetical protein Acr_25g0002120 [Actinidia rufa]